MKQKYQKNLIGAVIASALLLGLIFVLTSEEKKSTAEPGDSAAAPFWDMDFDASSAEDPGSPAAPKAALMNYLEYAKYPPASRPITPQRAEHFQYNKRDDVPSPVAGPDGRAALYISVRTDKMMVFGNESARVLVKAVTSADPSASRKMIERLAGAVYAGRGENAPRVLDLTFVDNGRDGDLEANDQEYTAVLTPVNVPALRNFHGDVSILVDFIADGAAGARKTFLSYYPPSAIAAQLTGKFREEIENGSLVVYAQINVARAGNFTLDANLLDASGQPFCHSRAKEILSPGLQEVRLLFFGKVIRDAGASSPFRMTEIFGQALPSGESAAMETPGFAPFAVPLFQGEYRTRAYDMAEFSDAEWDSPDKQFHLLQYREAAEKGSWIPK